MRQWNEENNIELRSEEFQDVLGAVPHWILRWGITSLAVIVVVLLAGSAVFKYPDIISSSMTLTGSTPPATIVAKSSGKLQELYVTDNRIVKKGEFLAIIENPAETTDILLLRNYLHAIDPETGEIPVLLPKHLKLGMLQSTYSSFYISLSEYSEYKRLQYNSIKSGIIHKRVEQYENQFRNLALQRKIIQEQSALTKNKYQRDSVLNKKGILAHEELESTKNQYLQSVLACENITSSMDNCKIQIGQMKETLFETNYQDVEKNNSLTSKLKTLITQLQSELQSWELNYALTSPIDGKITFSGFWAVNQNVTAGEPIFDVVPTASVQLLGKALLPATRSGKVEVGQKVNIRFENFPDNEYGMIRGTVKNISLVPTKEKEAANYTVEIALPDGLKTTYGKTLPYQPQMTARADIITKDISLLERFFMPLRKAISEGLE